MSFLKLNAHGNSCHLNRVIQMNVRQNFPHAMLSKLFDVKCLSLAL